MSAPVAIGAVLAGKYRIEAVLGEGGMGVVVAAHHLQLDEKVAIKFLLPSAAAHAEIITRFAREARAAAKIKSQHVARVIDVGALEDGAPYMVMEFLEGRDLATLLAADGPLAVRDACGYVIEACEALAEAHSLGIIHRDLKPANLFLARQPGGESIVKVLDFGISKLVDAGLGGDRSPSLGLTKTHVMLGSPLYMSLEQMTRPKEIDTRADIWSLGVVLYELVTGSTPFMGENLAGLLANMLQGTPRPPSSFRPSIPTSFDHVISKCIHLEPSKRFGNIAVLAAALGQYVPRQDRIERISRVLGVNLSAASIAPARLEEPRALVGSSPQHASTLPLAPPRASSIPAPAWPGASEPPRSPAQASSAPGAYLHETQGAWDAPQARARRPTNRRVVPIVLGSLVAAGAATALYVGARRAAQSPAAGIVTAFDANGSASVSRPASDAADLAASRTPPSSPEVIPPASSRPASERSNGVGRATGATEAEGRGGRASSSRSSSVLMKTSPAPAQGLGLSSTAAVASNKVAPVSTDAATAAPPPTRDNPLDMRIK